MANIINACARISGTKLQSGEKVSFNLLTGKKTSANGDKNAGVEITKYHNHSEGVA